MVDRSSPDRVREVLEAEGFKYRHVARIDVLLDSPEASVRDGVHLIFAGEMVRPNEPGPNPEMNDTEAATDIQVLSLEALVTIKLTAFRRKDQVHLQDMIEVGLIDQSWTNRLPAALANRLQELLDDPKG